MEQGKISRREFLKAAGIALGSSVLAACTPNLVKPTDTEAPTSIFSQTLTTETSQAIIIEPTVTLSPEPIKIPEYIIEAGGKYTEAQQNLIDTSEAVKTQKDEITSWMNNYWIKFQRRPFATDSQELNWTYFFDDNNNPQEVGVAVNVGGEYGNKLFYLPIGSDMHYMTTPPAVPDNPVDIPTGFGPLEISAGDQGLVLAFRDGNWVRIDQTGMVVQEINLGSKKWEGPPTSSYEYQIVESTRKSYVGHAYGIETPIDFGVDKVVSETLQLDSFQEIMDDYAVSYIKSAFWRYTKLMGNTDANTVEEYAALLKQGRGMLIMKIFNETVGDAIATVTKLQRVDPREGFAITFSSASSFPIKIASGTRGTGSAYLSTDSSGRIMATIDFSEKTYNFLKQPSAPPDVMYEILAVTGMSNQFLGIVGLVDNSCLRIDNACVNDFPQEFWDFINPAFDAGNSFKARTAFKITLNNN